MEEIEIWKDIPNYEKSYQASNLGRIKSLERRVIYSSNPLISHNLKTRILKDFPSREYRSVKLFTGFRNNKTLLVHRLVAKTFIPNIHSLSHINHINGIKWDNRIENLEWVTHNYNVRHAYETGLKNPKNYKGIGNKTSKLKDNEILSMRKEYSEGNTSYSKLSKKYSISPSNVYSIIKRQTWGHI